MQQVAKILAAHNSWSVVARYAVAVAIFLIALFLRLAFLPKTGGLPYITFYPAILISFYLCGTGPGAIVAILSGVVGIHLLVPPYGEFAVHLRDYTSLVFFGITAALIGWAIATLRAKEQFAKYSEARLARAMEATNDGLWEWDIASGKGYFSPAYYKMLGYSEGEFASAAASWLELIHPEDRERALAANQACIDNRVESFATEFRMRTKDGEWRWILGRGKAVRRESSGKALMMLGTHVDITERKRTEEALKVREERFQALFDRASDGIMILSPNGRLIAVNNSYAQMHGYTAQEMQSLNLRDLDTPETFRLAHGRMQRILAGETMTFEVEHYHKDGHVFPLEVSASFISSNDEQFIQTFHRDITERNRQRDLITEHNALLTRQKVELEATLGRIKRLEGMISICVYCKKIRSESNAWHQLEKYITEHSDAFFSHGLCPECLKEQMGD